MRKQNDAPRDLTGWVTGFDEPITSQDRLSAAMQDDARLLRTLLRPTTRV